MSGGQPIHFMVIMPDGSITVADLTLSMTEMQTLVGGDFEMLPAPDSLPVKMFANTDGKLKGLPPNWKATSLLRSKLRNDEFLVGPIVITGLPNDSGELTELSFKHIEAIRTLLAD
jgi:hypothetical protein